MIANIAFRHMGEDVKSLLIFNFGAVKDVIIVMPEGEGSLQGWTSEEKNEGIVFTRTAEDVWVCPRAAVNRFPETFTHLENVMRRFFNKDKFSFRRRVPMYAGRN